MASSARWIADDLVVADEKKPLALAGVMGGWDTMITPETKNILVEAAWFDPAVVRRSSKRHLLHTDASHRFERGADFNAPPAASALVSQVILESGGYAVGELVDVVIPEAVARTAKRPSVTFSLSEVQRILGPTEDPAGITAPMAVDILARLGCGVEEQKHPAPAVQAPQDLNPSRAVLGEAAPNARHANGLYSVTLPSWRLDLEREIDLIEEIARVYGYNRFKNTLPSFAGSVIELPWAEKEAHRARHPARARLERGHFLELLFSRRRSALRPRAGRVRCARQSPQRGGRHAASSLLPGMLDMLALNISRDVEGAALFEMGTVFSGGSDRVDERPSLAFGATGLAFGSQPADFYDVKGLAEALLGKFASRSFYFDRFPADSGLMPAWLHPGRSARAVLDGATMGWFGQLHPAEAERRKLKQAVWIGELWLDRLYKQALRQPVIEELSRYQPVRRDFSVTLSDSVTWAKLAAAIEALAIPELRSFVPAEVLRDPKGKLVPAGHYSLLLRVVFQSHERTLRDEEVQRWSQQVIAALEAQGGKLRT